MIVVRRTILFALLIAAVSHGYAQSNDVVDTLLAQKEAVMAQTAYLALVGGGWLAENASPKEAFDLAVSKRWLPRKASPDSTLTLNDFSLLAMHGLKMKGGIGWSLFRTRRYAFRELVALGILNASGGAERIPSGEEVIRMIGNLAGSDRRKK